MSPPDIAGLIEPTRVHARVYTDPAIFALEQTRIFGRLWIFLAHESRLPQPGDFVRARLGGSEVLVVRQRDGTINALHNRCAHRGALVCAAAHGSARTFVCPYHGWAFGLDGALRGVPKPDGYAALSETWRLEPVARVESYRGFVFASLAASGPSLTDHLGGLTRAFDNMVDRAPDGTITQHPYCFRQEYRGNWKLHMENATDTVHPMFVHESSVEAGRSAGPEVGAQAVQMLQANGLSLAEWDTVGIHTYPGGHSWMGGFYRAGAIAAQRADPVFADYRQRLVTRHGEAKTAEILAMDRFNNLVYPNLSINPRFQQLRQVHPIAADRTVVHSHCFILGGAPPEIARLALRFLNTANSPASLISTDDLEVFNRTQARLTGDGDAWVDFSRGAGTERPNPDDEAQRAPGTAEASMRAQYRAWLAAMTSP
jgi:phenylpropionate dioxygenase-like ring-hydroxylating dioxygenase large terminal subunit